MYCVNYQLQRGGDHHFQGGHKNMGLSDRGVTKKIGPLDRGVAKILPHHFPKICNPPPIINDNLLNIFHVVIRSLIPIVVLLGSWQLPPIETFQEDGKRKKIPCPLVEEKKKFPAHVYQEKKIPCPRVSSKKNFLPDFNLPRPPPKI